MVETGRVSAAPTTALSFVGQVDLDGRPVDVAVTVVDGVVSLLVGEDSIGSWRFGEIEFVKEDTDTFSVRADGDTLTFRPADSGGFEDFLADGRTSSPQPTTQTNVVDDVDFSIPVRPETKVHAPTLLPSDDPGELLESLVSAEPRSRVEWETETDEYFAAGLNGPPIEGAPAQPAIRFNRLPAISEPTPVAPVEIPPEPNPIEQEDNEVSAGVEVPSPPDTGESETEFSPGRDADIDYTEELDPVEVAMTPEGAASQPRPSRLRRLRAKPAAKKTAAKKPEAEEARVETEELAPTSEEPTISVTDRIEATRPMDDGENLRQWALVVGGGIVGLILLAVVVGVILAAIGGNDADSAALTPIEEAPAATVVVPSTLSAPATTPPATPVETDPADGADATEFVAQWNALASTYAYHMAIAATDTLPIETALTSTIRITYGVDRSVRLDALPQGERGDRDILVAMGMVVAWAEPQLSPGDRAGVLGGLGIDIENPQLDSIGGMVRRNGIVYEATVLDRVIRFTVRR